MCRGREADLHSPRIPLLPSLSCFPGGCPAVGRTMLLCTSTFLHHCSSGCCHQCDFCHCMYFLPPSLASPIHAELQMCPDSLSAVSPWQGPLITALAQTACQPYSAAPRDTVVHRRVCPCRGSQMANSLRCGAPTPTKKDSLQKEPPKVCAFRIPRCLSKHCCRTGSGYP